VKATIFIRSRKSRKDFKNLLEEIRITQKVDTASALDEFEDAQMILEAWVRDGRLTYQDGTGKTQSVSEKIQVINKAVQDI